MKELEPWDGGSDDVTEDPLAVQLDDPKSVSSVSGYLLATSPGPKTCVTFAHGVYKSRLPLV